MKDGMVSAEPASASTRLAVLMPERITRNDAGPSSVQCPER